MSAPKKTWIVVRERLSSKPRGYDEPSKAAARRTARAMLGGCVRGEGTVTLYPADPATTESEPLLVRKA